MFDFDSLPTPGDFEAFKDFFSSGPDERTIANCDNPSIPDGLASHSQIMHASLAPMLDVCPRTPRGTTASVTDTEVPTVPHPHTAPCLLEALQKKDVDALMAALTEDPGSAMMPFMEHNMEPPLCAAVRLRCPADMIAALLERGADPEADDMWGNTAMRHLQQQKSSTTSCAEYVAKVEELLLKQGAKQSHPELSMDELMLQDTFAQWPKLRFGPTQRNEACDGGISAPQFLDEWHLQLTSEQVEDLFHLASWSRSEPAARKHMAVAISSI
jgi:hypothetical protein